MIGNRKTETSKEHLLENKIASINESVEFETIMHLEKFKPEYIAKPTSKAENIYKLQSSLFTSLYIV
jgi:hypothetical protein